MSNIKFHPYRSVNETIFQEPQSQAWFYTFPFEWVWYHSNRGFPTYSDAREAAENHIDKVLATKPCDSCGKPNPNHEWTNYCPTCREQWYKQHEEIEEFWSK